MIPSTGTGVRQEPDSLLTGVCELSLTRAILTYDDRVKENLPGGRLGDLGVGVVLDGSRPSRSEVLDLGSAEVRPIPLRGPLVILEWVYPSTIRSLREGLASDANELRRFTFSLALRVLERTGFSGLTRPLVLRLGFRDLVQDIDLHEGTAVRLLLPAGGVVRMHLEYETATLVVRTGVTTRNPSLEGALRDAFSETQLLGTHTRDSTGLQTYHLPFAPPASVEEARQLLRRMRRGFLHLLARFEPERYGAVREQLDTFGERDSLRQLRLSGSRRSLKRLEDRGDERRGRVH